MENIKQAPLKKPHSIDLSNRKNGAITGVEKVISSCDTCLALATCEGGLTIAGANLKINKFNVDDGTLSFEGEINSLKYNAAKVPVLKRIFK